LHSGNSNAETDASNILGSLQAGVARNVERRGRNEITHVESAGELGSQDRGSWFLGCNGQGESTLECIAKCVVEMFGEVELKRTEI